MPRLLLAAAVLLAAVAPLSAADPVPKPTGNWKFQFEEGGQPIVLLLAFTEEDGKWVGDYIGSNAQLQADPKVKGLAVKDDAVKFAIELKGKEAFNFDGLLAKDGKKLVGSVSKFGGPPTLTELYPTKLKKLADPVDLAREEFAQRDGGAEWFELGFLLAGKAAEKKWTADDARGLADRLTKAAAGYGPRWEFRVALRLATAFAAQDGFADIAVAQAQRAERMLADDAPIATQLEVIGAVAAALTKAGKADDAKKYTATLAKLEARDLAEYTKAVMTFDTPEFKGRKGKSDRVVVVELFTGSDWDGGGPLAAAFDGLRATYKPADVVFVQYHLHVPTPDPLATPDGMRRTIKLYGQRLTGPGIRVNGKAVGKGTDAKELYAEFVEAINAELEKPSGAKVALTAAKDEKGLKVTAKVTDLEKPGEKVTLRLAVVEESVRYAGDSGARYHRQVLRAMPGGADGFALTKKEHEYSVVVNADDIRKELNKALDDFAAQRGEFPRPDRPLALKNLTLVAFVQDDSTNEVLAATQIALDGK